MKTVIRCLLILGIVLAGGWLPIASTQAMPFNELPANGEAANVFPAQPPGAVLPTINLSTSHGKAGESITVSGQGVSPYPSVRAAWLLSDVTLTAAVVHVAANNAYSATITVPVDAAPGSVRVCAAVTGTTLAGFACSNFTIDPIAPGSVQGTIPLVATNAPQIDAPQAITATVNLYDQQGKVIGSAPIQNDGSFNVAAVPPGSYTAGVAGIVPVLVTTRTISVQSAQISSVNFTPFTQCYAASVVAVRITPTGKPTTQYDFGTYLSFWPYSPDPKPVMEADLLVSSGANVSGVSFKVTDANGDTTIIGFPGTPTVNTTYAITRTVGDWLPGVNLLKIEPSGTKPNCNTMLSATRRVNVIQHPMTPTALQHFNDRRIQDTKWDGSRYVFNVDMPDHYDSFDIISPPPFFQNGEPILPTVFPNPAPDLDYLGVSENKHGAAFSISGTLDLDGNVTFTAVRGRAGAFALSQRSINGQHSFIPESAAGIPALAMLPTVIDQAEQRSGLLAPAVFPPTFNNLRDIHHDFGPETLFPFDEEAPVYEGVLFSLFGLANIKVSISVGVSGDVTISGTIWPLAPDLDMRAKARVSPRVDVDVIGDILGIVSVGGTARTEGTVIVPAHVSSKDDRLVWLEDPCMRLKVILYLWMAIGIGDASKEWNLDPQTLLDYTNGACSATRLASAPDAVPSRPRLFSSPNVISGPGGRMLSVYVEDTSPGTTNPVPKVMARFWSAGGNQWGSAFALTDGAHMVQDPVGAFYGGGDNAIVAWTETYMTLAEEQAAGNDLNAMLSRQEIFYAVWNGTQWSASTRLTNDVVSDGQASFAGDDFGATLVWIRDTDGSLSTRQDMRVAAQDWNASGNISGTMAVLSTTLNSMASQVAVARSSNDGTSRRALAWITDLDGDATTGSDRDIAIADWNGNKWNVAVPVIAALMNAPEAPSIALVPGSQDLYLTFVERRKDPNGADSGIGNNSVLWTARRTGSSWQSSSVLDENSQRVRAERPQISIGPGGEALVAFRRFGTVGTHAELGQLSLTKLASNGSASAPLYLTDEARQHWQQSIAINSTSDQAVVLSVGRDAASGAQAMSIEDVLTSADAGARPSLQTNVLVATADPIESLVVEPGADPALNAKLTLASAHAAPGTNVVVTATLRNLGRASATGLTVNLYAGLPFTGTLIGAKNISDTAFNGSRVVTFTVTTTTGNQPIYAQVTTSGGNVSTANDLATADPGELLPPTLVIVRPSPRYANALEIAWQPPAIAGIEGYRILRKQTAGGSFELVGEATGMLLVDTPVQRGTTYSYVVQSYDASGVLSEFSAEVTGLLPLYNLYLPLIRR